MAVMAVAGTVQVLRVDGAGGANNICAGTISKKLYRGSGQHGGQHGGQLCQHVSTAVEYHWYSSTMVV